MKSSLKKSLAGIATTGVLASGGVFLSLDDGMIIEWENTAAYVQERDAEMEDYENRVPYPIGCYETVGVVKNAPEGFCLDKVQFLKVLINKELNEAGGLKFDGTRDGVADAVKTEKDSFFSFVNEKADIL